VIDLGINRLMFTGPSLDADPAEAAVVKHRLDDEILLALRAS
jgi:hypothetical protein